MPLRYKYPDGGEYYGDWDGKGQRHGMGQMTFADSTRYVGAFDNGFSNGLGVMYLADGSRYEGEFNLGKFNGYGVFTRCDGMRYEGEFKEGKIGGLGLLTFADGTHGLPRNEGFFEGSALVKREKCPHAVNKALQAGEQARSRAQSYTQS